MKIFVSNSKESCNICHNETYIFVDIYYNSDQVDVVSSDKWSEVLGEGYSSISAKDTKAIRICKNCISLLWNTVARVNSRLCRYCRKPLPVRLFKSESGTIHQYKIDIDVTDPRHGYPFCSEACYHQYIAAHP